MLNPTNEELGELLRCQTRIQVTRSFLQRKQFCGSCTLPFEVSDFALGLRCGHYFHPACLTVDLATSLSRSCPLDNIKIQPKLRRQNAIARWLPPADDMNPSPKLSSLSSNPDVVQILYPPLEVRVCRMSLSERPRDQQTYKQNFSQPTLRPKKTSPKPKRKRLKAPKEKLRKEPVQLPVIGGVPETMQRNLSAQIQPLMAVLMSPRPQSASTSSYGKSNF
ncbi:unnamed protein product [Bemisia tabaci]|uniref:RING-type domain-containing protein n=2 Tax=Bemisia tabaci TaxID=7038 RepID=A0A9N9ZXY5_BEMTA|nr:unnamed protein product [Bemisia tabaci]